MRLAACCRMNAIIILLGQPRNIHSFNECIKLFLATHTNSFYTFSLSNSLVIVNSIFFIFENENIETHTKNWLRKRKMRQIKLFIEWILKGLLQSLRMQMLDFFFHHSFWFYSTILSFFSAYSYYIYFFITN